MVSGCPFLCFRSFTNALHAFVGVGLLTATFMVRPFLPSESKAAQDRDVVCGIFNASKNETSTTSEDSDTDTYQVAYIGGVDAIAWPFLISGVWCVVVASGYFVLGKKCKILKIRDLKNNIKVMKTIHSGFNKKIN